MGKDSGRNNSGVVVIGLGRFGSALALELVDQDIEVLGIDGRPKIVQDLAPQLTHVVVADSTDEQALRQLSVHEFDRVVIGIGNDVEASILTASLVLQMGVPNIWAKAISAAHARILTQLGVHHVVRPEHDMGQRVAHLVGGRMLDYIEFDEDFAMTKTSPPAAILGKPLGQTTVRSQYGITVVAVKPPGQEFTYATIDTVLHHDDLIIVSGTPPAYRRIQRTRIGTLIAPQGGPQVVSVPVLSAPDLVPGRAKQNPRMRDGRPTPAL